VPEHLCSLSISNQTDVIKSPPHRPLSSPRPADSSPPNPIKGAEGPSFCPRYAVVLLHLPPFAPSFTLTSKKPPPPRSIIVRPFLSPRRPTLTTLSSAPSPSLFFSNHRELPECYILAQDFNRIDRILIPRRYSFFFRSLTAKKTSGLSVLGPEQFQDG
jgi:hypothetical protein